MTREEAIRILASSCISGSKQTEALETLIPELAESEDERIRKEIIHYILYETKGTINEATEHTWVKWLEKQKENPKSADSISSDCMSDAKCEDRDSNYGVFPEDVIVVARACEKLEAHGYPELAHALKNVNLYTKEQKPVDYDHEMWKNCEANFEGGKKEVIEHPEKYGLQKQEWSEEDKKIIDTIVSVLGQYIDYKAVSGTGSGYATPRYSKEIDWLNSLSLNLKKKNEDVAKLCSNEWSKEDEDTINLMIAILRENHPNSQFKTNPVNTTCMSAISTDMLIKKIEALRPQYHGDVTMTEAYKMGKEAGEASSWKPSEEYGKDKDFSDCLTELACELYECHDESDSPEDTSIKEHHVLEKWEPILLKKAQIWKPSEEQIDRLFSIVAALRKDYCDDMADFLANLYADLKKLGVKEEPEYYQHFDPDC